MSEMYRVKYHCSACRCGFTVRQGDPGPDEDITLCNDCTEIMFSSGEHGTHDDPWTYELIRQARQPSKTAKSHSKNKSIT